MQISDTGLAIVKSFEGCLQLRTDGMIHPYIDPVGVLTVGWGHTNHHDPKFTANERWTRSKCDDVLVSDMQVFNQHVGGLAPSLTDPNKFSALVSWSYNTGGPSTSAVWKYVGKDDQAVYERLQRWNRGGGRVLPGLVRRRKAEGELYLGKVHEALATAGASMATSTMPNARGDRNKPRPPAGEVAGKTKKEIGTAVGGGASTGATSAQDKHDWLVQAAIGVSVAITLIAIILLVRKAKAYVEDWA